MKQLKPFARLLPLLACLTMVIVSPTSKALAQAYLGHLRFLENFAVRLYDRGETDQAMKEFQRLQTIDPSDPVAADYLKKLSTGIKPAVRSKTSTDRLNSIAEDVEALKNDIASYERDTKELETMIRDLITENDGLYVMLDKRTRELMELRSQLFGTPYADNYRELEKTLPIARVPQRLHRAEDYLPENAPATPTGNANVAGTVNAAGPEAEQLLTEKRDLMVNKALAMAQNTDTLSQVKGELADMNERLKRASGKSASMLDDIDRYYRDVKEEIALRNYDSQRAFSDLIIDYAAKVRELENLKSSILLRDNALTNVKPQIATQSDEVVRLNQALADKDHQIAVLNAQLLKLQEENSAQKATLEHQATDISLTTGQLETVSTAVDKIEKLLRANDQKIADLESRSSRVNMLTHVNPVAVANQNASLEQLKEEAGKKTALTLELQQKNSELTAKLAAREKDLSEAQNAIQALKTEASTLKGGTVEEAATLKELRGRLTELDNAASRKASALTEQQQNLAHFSAQLEKFEGQVADLRQTIADKEAQLQSAKRELAEKDKKLDNQDNFIVQLEEKSQLLDNQRLSLQSENDRLTAELKSLQAGPTPTPANESLIVDLRNEIAESDAKIKAVTGENKRLAAMIEIYEVRSRIGVKPAANPVVNETDRKGHLDLALDSQEKSTLIQHLKEELASQDKVLAAAQAKAAENELKSSAGEFKKQAMKNVIDKRDDQLLKLKSELDLAKEDLAKVNAEVRELRAVQNKLFVAENKLKDSGREADDLRQEITQVREQLRAAYEVSAKNDVAVKRLENEKTQLEKALAKKTEPLTSYQDKMKSFTWQSAQDRRRLLNELAQVKARMADRTAEIANLQKKFQELSKQIPGAMKKPESGTVTGENKASPLSDTTGCLLHCEEQQPTNGDTSGCLLKCQPQK